MLGHGTYAGGVETGELTDLLVGERAVAGGVEVVSWCTFLTTLGLPVATDEASESPPERLTGTSSA